MYIIYGIYSAIIALNNQYNLSTGFIPRSRLASFFLKSIINFFHAAWTMSFATNALGTHAVNNSLWLVFAASGPSSWYDR